MSKPSIHRALGDTEAVVTAARQAIALAPEFAQAPEFRRSRFEGP
jgi:hypothetical protein